MSKIVIDYCKNNNLDCDNEPFDATVGKYEYTFCCENGFFKSVEAFNNSVK